MLLGSRFAATCRAADRTRLVWRMLVVAGMSFAAGTLTGCGPSAEERRLQRAMFQVRTDPNPDLTEAIETLSARRSSEKHRSEFVQYSMCELTAAMMAGCRHHASELGKHAYLAVKKYEDVDRETLAAWGNEAIKFFKGEPHERAMLCFYVGLLCYIDGDYNNARVFFAQSLQSTATRDDDMANHREDFGLGHYWLGRAYLRLGETDDARVAFTKAGERQPLATEERDLTRIKKSRASAYKQQLELEKKCHQNGSNGKKPVAGIVNLSQPTMRDGMPVRLEAAAESSTGTVDAADITSFLDVGFQEQVNLILVVELGVGPVKYLTGSSGAIDEYKRSASIERSVDVYIDGYRRGPAFGLVDMYHQAITRGVKTRRGRQVTKAVAKEVLTRMPLVGGLFGYWNIGADSRFWPSLPDQVAVYAAKVEPGFHDISLRFYDINGAYLPRFDINRHYIHVPETGERVVWLHSVENQDNAYVLAQSNSNR